MCGRGRLLSALWSVLSGLCSYGIVVYNFNIDFAFVASLEADDYYGRFTVETSAPYYMTYSACAVVCFL